MTTTLNDPQFSGRGIHIRDRIIVNGRSKTSSLAYEVAYGARGLKSFSYGVRRTKQEAWDLAVKFMTEYARDHFLTIREKEKYE